MSDTLSQIPLKYEPLKNNRFIVKFPSDMGIQVWWVTASGLPSISISSVPIPFLNTETYVAGKYTWEPFDITFRNLIGPSTVQALMEWVRLEAESVTGRMGYAAGYKRDFTIEMLDPTNVTVSKWLVKNAWITKSSQGNLSYDDDKLNETTISIAYDYAINIF